MSIDIEAIRARNADANIYCKREACPQFRCAHVKADIDALLAEVERLQAERDDERNSALERRAAELKRMSGDLDAQIAEERREV